MPAKKSSRRPAPQKPGRPKGGCQARTAGQTLETWTLGALPIVNRLLDRMRLEEHLQRHLPPDDSRLEVPTSRVLLLLIRNVLFSREPLYGVAEWAQRYAPDLLGLTGQQLGRLNDDRSGRSLDRLFDAATPQLIMDMVRHVVHEFDLQLSELHNDSTTVSFFGDYPEAAEPSQRRGRNVAAITYGHSKARRPDLKQLLFTLTVADDGGVPVYFTTASGNVTDDGTHQETWDLLRELIGGPEFLYVADCKLASTANLEYIDRRGGRFVSVLPRTRREDREFRQRVRQAPQAVAWEPVYDVKNEQGDLLDRLKACSDAQHSEEGFRLVWFHSTRKAARDEAWRTRTIQRTLQELEKLRERMQSPRTRFRQRTKVEQAVQDILEGAAAQAWVRVQIVEETQATYKQAQRGRPGKDTKYQKQTATRFNLTCTIDQQRQAEDAATDGVFPLITNDREMSAEQLLRAYKRQPLIEKRFSQFKSDFQVAPVYLEEISRIHALLCVYFFALTVQALLEREIRRAMAAEHIEALPLYPEERTCRAPTTRRILDVFENIQRHRLHGDEPLTFVTQLSPLQKELLRLLRIPEANYRPRD